MRNQVIIADTAADAPRPTLNPCGTVRLGQWHPGWSGVVTGASQTRTRTPAAAPCKSPRALEWGVRSAAPGGSAHANQNCRRRRGHGEVLMQIHAMHRTGVDWHHTMHAVTAVSPRWCRCAQVHASAKIAAGARRRVGSEAHPEECTADVATGVIHAAETLRVRLQALCPRQRRHRESEERPLLQHGLKWLRRTYRCLGGLHARTVTQGSASSACIRRSTPTKSHNHGQVRVMLKSPGVGRRKPDAISPHYSGVWSNRGQ